MPHFENFTEGRAGAWCISCVCGCQVWARVCEKGVDGVLCGAQTHKCPKEGSNRSVQNPTIAPTLAATTLAATLAASALAALALAAAALTALAARGATAAVVL